MVLCPFICTSGKNTQKRMGEGGIIRGQSIGNRGVLGGRGGEGGYHGVRGNGHKEKNGTDGWGGRVPQYGDVNVGQCCGEKDQTELFFQY